MAELMAALDGEGDADGEEGERVDRNQVQMLIRLIPGILLVDEERIRCPFHRLPTIADQAYLIMRDRGSPEHFREIALEIARRTARENPDARTPSPPGVSLAMSQDDRFKPIARTGLWALVEWKDVSTAPIIDLAYEAAFEAGRPLAMQEIVEYVSRHRPDVKESSIVTVVYDDEHLVRDGEGRYGL